MRVVRSWPEMLAQPVSLKAAKACGSRSTAAQVSMPFAIYLDPEAARSHASGEDYLVPDTAELHDYLAETPLLLGRAAERTLTPAHDLAAHLLPGPARDALLDMEEPSVVLVVERAKGDQVSDRSIEGQVVKMEKDAPWVTVTRRLPVGLVILGLTAALWMAVVLVASGVLALLPR
jgi:hypothetical protein